MAPKFSLVSFKGTYDFGAKTSVYKSNFILLGNEGWVKTCPQTDDAGFELEGDTWEVGYSHKPKLLHGKKKWRIGRNNTIVMRQDISNLDFAVLPSPEIQLENVVLNTLGLDKNKLELKYHTFWKTAEVEEEARFGGRFRLKGAIDSATKLEGAKLALKADVSHPILKELEIAYCKKHAIELIAKLKPGYGSTIKARARPLSKSVGCEFEYDFKKEGLKLEVKTQVSDKGAWTLPGVEIGFDF